MSKLVIVESPTKAKTISRFLGKGFVVESSFGHIRDLPPYELAIDVDNNFEPKYVVSKKSRAHVKKLKDAAKKADSVILATDEDREGEAIAWHLAQALGLGSSKFQKTNSPPKADQPRARKHIPNVERIVFHEITKGAIEDALKHPRSIDMNLVDAQQARRVLDRLVGYKLSPLLWKKIARGLSAGRVQSVAVRLVVERERDIQNFKPQEYWSIAALLKGTKEPQFTATLAKKDRKTLDKFAVKTKKEADDIIRNLEGATWNAANIEKREVAKNPPPPFTTSTLQQTASQRLGFSPRQTMRIAQQLYETGLITYMRTDSLNIAEGALAAAHNYLASALGNRYTLPHARTFKTKAKGAQEAHEAIRPTDPANAPQALKSKLEAGQEKLYQLIWQRFLATQMPTAIFDATTVDVTASKMANAEYTFRSSGQILKFDGFLKIYPLSFEETTLPELKKGEALTLLGLSSKQHFTEPLPRYSEASLIKMLETHGIGRPSTYAPIMSTIQDRGYVTKNQQKRLCPTDMGTRVNDLLVEHFPRIVDVQFTAEMEEEFDEIAEGKKEWVPAIREFYTPFEKTLQEKYASLEKQDLSEETDKICEKCGKPMVIKLGRFGRFLACTGFPECRNTKPLPPSSLGIACPQCKEGEIVERSTKRGKMFYGCMRYPQCNFALWEKPTGAPCPTCNSLLIEKGRGIVCSNKDCGS